MISINSDTNLNTDGKQKKNKQEKDERKANL